MAKLKNIGLAILVLCLCAAMPAGGMGRIPKRFALAQGSSSGITIPAGSSLNLNTATVVVPGDIINYGTLGSSTGTIELTGDWVNNGTFNPGTGLVEFVGPAAAAQNISGSSSFYNFVCTRGGLNLNFGAGTTQIITHYLTLNGASGSLLFLRSSSNSTQWVINPQAWNVSYVDVKDSNNTGPNIINPSNSVDSGNNLRWWPSQTPEDAIADLMELLDSMGIQRGINTALDQMLDNTRASLTAANADQRNDSISHLEAFINLCEAQRGKKLTVAQANQLISAANAIIAMLR